MTDHSGRRNYAPVLRIPARLRQKATMKNQKSLFLPPRKYEGGNDDADAAKETVAHEHNLGSAERVWRPSSADLRKGAYERSSCGICNDAARAAAHVQPAPEITRAKKQRQRRRRSARRRTADKCDCNSNVVRLYYVTASASALGQLRRTGEFFAPPLEEPGGKLDQTLKDSCRSEEMKVYLKECRQAKKQLFEAIEADRANYKATVRDIKLLCAATDDDAFSKTNTRIRQYYEMRCLLASRNAAGEELIHEKRLILDELSCLNADLELALAERQSALQRKIALGNMEQKLCTQLSPSRNSSPHLGTPPREALAQRDGTRKAVEELLASMTRLQQENQQLHEENVRLRRALATGQPSHCEPELEEGRHGSPYSSNTARAAPSEAGKSALSEQSNSKSLGVRRWQHTMCPTKTRRHRRVGAHQVQALLETGGFATIAPHSGEELARSLVGAFKLMYRKFIHFKRKSFILQSKCKRQRHLGEARRGEALGPVAEPGEEAFTSHWKLGILEAEILRLRRLLELSAGTSLSLATIHQFFLDQKTALQRQAITEAAAIEALENQIDIIQNSSLDCGSDDDSYESSDDLSGLAAHTGDMLSSSAATQQAAAKQVNNALLLEKAFRATFDAAADALDALKGRHAETGARLAQIQSGLIDVEQDLKLLGKEQRLETEKHIKELSVGNKDLETATQVCYKRQLLGPDCAEREVQTDASGIAFRRLLYTGEYRVSDSAACPVSVSIINEEDVVVKLMLDDMEHPPCLYMAFAGIRFLSAPVVENKQVSGHAARAPAAGTQATGMNNISRAETLTRPFNRRRWVPDEGDGRAIAEMLDIEHIRGVPCLILKGQEVGIPAAQDPRPHTTYEEECLYNDKVAVQITCPVFGPPLMLQLMQCARRRCGMLFFHLCVYNSITGWLKYASVSSKDLCRRFGFASDKDLLETLGNVRRRGMVAEGVVTKKLLELFKECLGADLVLAASTLPPVPQVRSFSPKTIVLLGGLSTDEKGEIIRQTERERAKQSRSSTHIKCAEPMSSVALADNGAEVSRQPGLTGTDPNLSHLYGGVLLKPPDAYVFICVRICITWDCDVDILLEFE